MIKKKVSKKYMLRLIGSNNPVFLRQDKFGLIYLAGEKFSFIYTPFGMITAFDEKTEYSCFDDDFIGLNKGIIA